MKPKLHKDAGEGEGEKETGPNKPEWPGTSSKKDDYAVWTKRVQR